MASGFNENVNGAANCGPVSIWQDATSRDDIAAIHYFFSGFA
jgi:hypothetical protein